MRRVTAAQGQVARGEGVQPLRAGFRLPGSNGVMAWMPGSLSPGEPFGVKVLSVIDNAGELGVASVAGQVLTPEEYELALESPEGAAAAALRCSIRTACAPPSDNGWRARVLSAMYIAFDRF